MKPDQQIPNGIYYVIHADTVGSTEHALRMGNTALNCRAHTFVECSRKALENAKMSSNSGRFVKSIGDGVLIVFSHFPDVVQWWLELQPLLHLESVDQEPLKARVRVHAGEVQFTEGDAFALAINQVVKLDKKARSHKFVLSEIAHALALPSVYPKQCVFKRCGIAQLDDCSRAIELHRLDTKAGIAFLMNKTREASQARNTG